VTLSGIEPVTFRKISAFLSLQLDLKFGMVALFLCSDHVDRGFRFALFSLAGSYF
jgi:hypothetical protein